MTAHLFCFIKNMKNQRELKFEYGFQSVNGIVKRDDWSNLIAEPITKDRDFFDSDDEFEKEMDRIVYSHYSIGNTIYPSDTEVIGNIYENPELCQ